MRARAATGSAARRRLARARLRAAVLLATAALGSAFGCPVRAQGTLDWDPTRASVLRFSNAPWSMISPNRDYEGGCVVGFMSFRFSPTGYFTFNNHVHGSWRIDELGNLKLRTRDGLRFTLVVTGSTLRATRDLPFLSHRYLFQQCPE